MYSEARKIHIIEEVLKADSEETLSELEAVIEKKKRKAATEKKPGIYDFVGILSKKEATAMKQAIEETSETIHPDDWR